MNDKKRMLKLVFNIVFFVVMIVVDQASKIMIIKNFQLFDRHVFIKDFFSFVYVRNTGSAWSFLADKSWGIYFLTTFSLILSVIILYFAYKAIKLNFDSIAIILTLLASGAVANNIDRLRLHYVVDFISFKFGSYSFPIFNFADICCVIATGLLIFMILFKGKEFDQFWENGILNKKVQSEEEKK